MFAIIGILVVFGAVVGGYLMEHGNLMVLMQPAELLIIGGAAAGTVLIANPLTILKGIAGGMKVVFGSSPFGKVRYVETLKQIYAVMQKARKGGLTELENDVEEPVQERTVLEVGSSRAGFRVRHPAHGHVRRTDALRSGSDDGTGHGSP